MHSAGEHEHDLQAVVDHELGAEDLRATLDWLIADPEATLRCAEYARQRELLTSLGEQVHLRPPTPRLRQMQDELRATVQQQEQMRVAVAVGGAMALMAAIGYASWSSSSHHVRQDN